jgi:hypothetical protein
MKQAESQTVGYRVSYVRECTKLGEDHMRAREGGSSALLAGALNHE